MFVCSPSVGLTWEDDATQQVLLKELSKLRRVPYRPQQNGAVYDTDRRSDVYPSVKDDPLSHHGPKTVLRDFTRARAGFYKDTVAHRLV